MKRGVMTFSPQSIALIQAHTAEIAEHHLQTWQKLSDAAMQTTEAVELELSKEEVEMILDLLPPPKMEDPEQLKQVRLRLLSFVQSLH